MSDRPYMRHRIDELETFFAESAGDASVLQQLETELSFRQVPRVVSLLAKVRAAQQGRMPEHRRRSKKLYFPEKRRSLRSLPLILRRLHSLKMLPPSLSLLQPCHCSMPTKF
jgi:hypothetical protein